MPKQQSIRDVAQLAGVSISTVSRAFTRPELVSKKTRERVMEAASTLDFNISRSATALKLGQTFRVALLMNQEITSWFNAQVFAGLTSVLHDAGYDISLFQHIDAAANRESFFVNLPVLRNVDAVFVASFAIKADEVEQLRRTRVPIVGINTPSLEALDASISIDDETGMYIATKHLLGLGHRNIVYTCSAAEATLEESIDARGHGFVRACTEAQASGRDIQWKVLSVPRGSGFADEALAAVLAQPEFPDAICCQMDMMAIPLMLGLQKHGYYSPRDYSIVGFDDSDYADTVELTTMRQDPFDMGAEAARKGLALLQGNALAEPHTTITPKLVVRGTDAKW